MGEIYRATDELLGRAVAVKVLAERYAEDASVRERFTREALAAARLSGVRTSSRSSTSASRKAARSSSWSTSAAARSRTASAAARVQTGQALDWLEQAAVALDAAHAEGVVHRDVKPANLLLDGADNVHVADFGIASAAGMDSLTKTGTVIGTAAYLSPEQAQGERATPGSDRYALAVVAWELLTGRRPFGGDTPAAEAAAHVHAEVPAIGTQRRDLPQELDGVFARALAKDRPTGTGRPPSSSPTSATRFTMLHHALPCSPRSRHGRGAARCRSWSRSLRSSAPGSWSRR